MKCKLLLTFFVCYRLLSHTVSFADGLTVWPANEADDEDTFITSAQHLRMNDIYDDLVKKREAERELERQNLEAIKDLPFHGNFTE